MAGAEAKPVLAATDLLETARHVVPRSAQLARTLGVELSVLHVLPGNGFSGEREADGERTAKLLSRQADAVADVDLQPGTYVGHGVPGAIIEAEGKRLGAGLYVLGFHRESPASTKRLGSTMSHLLVHTKADVLLVQAPAAGPYRSALIAWDGIKELTPAVEQTKIYAPKADIAVFLSVARAADLADGEATLRRAAAQAGLAAAETSLHVAADGLLAGLREALRKEDADLMVLPTRGSQGGDLGYVAAEILSQRLCDTLCLHQGH